MKSWQTSRTSPGLFTFILSSNAANFFFQESANEYNAMKVESTVITMSRLRPKDKNILFSTKIYGPTGFQQWASRTQSDDPNGGCETLFFQFFA